MENFKLYHVALYAKGWYKRENKKTLWEDLQVMLSLDDYNGELMEKGDIVAIILNHCSRLNTPPFKNLTEFANGISPSYCWKYGYYTKGNAIWKRDNEKLPEYDYYEAIVRYCLSNLVSVSPKELSVTGRLPMPDYIKGLPRKNGVTNKKLKEIFV